MAAGQRSLTVLALLFASVCGATSGNSISVTVLGLEPVDNKVYVLVEGGEFPDLQYVNLDRPNDWVRVQSWFQGQDWEQAFPARLEGLQARLTPLETRALTGLVIQESITAELPCPKVDTEYHCLAQQTQVSIETGSGHRAQWTHLSQGDSGVVRAWSLPNEDVLVLYRHQGLFYEGGYSVERPVLLTRPGPSAPTD
jgi:hypothetical protein